MTKTSFKIIWDWFLYFKERDGIYETKESKQRTQAGHHLYGCTRYPEEAIVSRDELNNHKKPPAWMQELMREQEPEEAIEKGA